MLLGAGGFGAVYLVKKENTDEHFALKLEKIADDEKQRGRLKAEFGLFVGLKKVSLLKQ